jgi:hypothetical protein
MASRDVESLQEEVLAFTPIREILNLGRTRQFSPARREIGAELLFLR